MISVVILTHNSQIYLKEVLSSVSFANEVVVVDSGSTDETLSIASEFKNVRVVHQSWLGFGAQKQKGVESAKNDWVFVLDSDEVFTKELQNEVAQVLNSPKFDAYKVPRLNFFFGRPLRKMGLYPDYNVRFFNKKKARFDGRAVHEKVEVTGSLGTLKNHFLHYAYTDALSLAKKQTNYAALAHKPNRLKALFSPCWCFFKMFVLKGGFLEGWRGYVVARIYAQYTFWKYL